MPLDTVAHCTKCGRKFVWVNEDQPEPWIDRFYPLGRWPTKMEPVVEICGGVIVLDEK